MPKDKKRNGVPSKNEFGKIRSFLAKHKVSQAQIKAALGGSVGGRDRAAIAQQLREWLKTRPKARKGKKKALSSRKRRRRKVRK